MKRKPTQDVCYGRNYLVGRRVERIEMWFRDVFLVFGRTEGTVPSQHPNPKLVADTKENRECQSRE